MVVFDVRGDESSPQSLHIITVTDSYLTALCKCGKIDVCTLTLKSCVFRV